MLIKREKEQKLNRIEKHFKSFDEFQRIAKIYCQCRNTLSDNGELYTGEAREWMKDQTGIGFDKLGNLTIAYNSANGNYNLLIKYAKKKFN